MKPARSFTHGGTKSASDHGRPLSSCWRSGSLFSLMFLRTAHEWLVNGDAHTRPVQSVSCQAMRTETCDIGSATAPFERSAMLYLRWRAVARPDRRSCTGAASSCHGELRKL